MSTIKVEKFIQAPPSEVYTYFTNATALRDWMCEVATTDPQPGGHLFLGWRGDYFTSGEYIKLEKDKFVSFTWLGKGEPHSTLVEISLRKQKGGTLIKLAHRKIGKGDKWAEIAKGYDHEWHSSFDNLASVLEQGPDLRITRRPMIGILLGEFNADLAKKMGVPNDYGVRISDVIDGMGAKKAGLRSDDVIVAMDGHEFTSGNIFGAVIRSKHAGDDVEVSYYRDGERKSAKMILSGRQIPPIPVSGAELSKQLEPMYKQFESQIEDSIKGTTEAECNKRPSEGEWSVNEILAHLIHSEVGWQNGMSEMISGFEASYDGFGDNIQARIDGTMTVYTSRDALLNQLKIHDAESLSMISHIPDDFVAHKGKFWKLVYQASQSPYHYQTHLDQIHAALDVAKAK